LLAFAQSLLLLLHPKKRREAPAGRENLSAFHVSLHQ
jgi:hypothetical protein